MLSTHEELSSDSSYSRISSSERYGLLEESRTVSGLSTKTLIIGLTIFFIILLNLIPKIYISNEIYYLSRDVIKLNNQYSLLIDEKHKLQRNLEDVKIKYLLENIGE